MNKAPRRGSFILVGTSDEFRPTGRGAENFSANGFPTALIPCPFGDDLHFESMRWTGDDDRHYAGRTARHSGQICHADATAGNVKYTTLIKSTAVGSIEGEIFQYRTWVPSLFHAFCLSDF
jgi:hypothetical protein